jgi:peptidoglycan hydrolase-like protein with peptidoglycan-binding domain
MSMRNRAVAMVTTALLGAGATGIALAPAASAAPPYNGIDGSGGVYDDWQDEKTIGVDDFAQSNATAVWETVLYADGAQYEDEDGDWHTFTRDKIDGSFGPETESATQWWQNYRGLSDSGVVTNDCWQYAQSRLSGPSTTGSVQYTGTTHNVTFKRVDGKYRVKLRGTGAWKNAYYDRVG